MTLPWKNLCLVVLTSTITWAQPQARSPYWFPQEKIDPERVIMLEPDRRPPREKGADFPTRDPDIWNDATNAGGVAGPGNIQHTNYSPPRIVPGWVNWESRPNGADNFVVFNFDNDRKLFIHYWRVQNLTQHWWIRPSYKVQPVDKNGNKIGSHAWYSLRWIGPDDSDDINDEGGNWVQGGNVYGMLYSARAIEYSYFVHPIRSSLWPKVIGDLLRPLF